jgi:hypothetical protein
VQWKSYLGGASFFQKAITRACASLFSSHLTATFGSLEPLELHPISVSSSSACTDSKINVGKYLVQPSANQAMHDCHFFLSPHSHNAFQA